MFSVHSIVSMDFATSVIPGWHTTIFPPTSCRGRSSPFAMVQTLLLIMRKGMNLENYIHVKHVEYMNIVIIVTGSIVGVAYLTELFIFGTAVWSTRATPSSTVSAALTAGRTG